LRSQTSWAIVARLRETSSVILASLSSYEQVVLDRMSAAMGHDVEEPLRSINDDMYFCVLPREYPIRAKGATGCVGTGHHEALIFQPANRGADIRRGELVDQVLATPIAHADTIRRAAPPSAFPTAARNGAQSLHHSTPCPAQRMLADGRAGTLRAGRKSLASLIRNDGIQSFRQPRSAVPDQLAEDWRVN
jgi:hypothetical protein